MIVREIHWLGGDYYKLPLEVDIDESICKYSISNAEMGVIVLLKEIEVLKQEVDELKEQIVRCKDCRHNYYDVV